MKKSCIYLENCKREMKTNKHLPAKNDLNHKIECIWAFLGYKMLLQFFHRGRFCQKKT